MKKTIFIIYLIILITCSNVIADDYMCGVSSLSGDSDPTFGGCSYTFVPNNSTIHIHTSSTEAQTAAQAYYNTLSGSKGMWGPSGGRSEVTYIDWSIWDAYRVGNWDCYPDNNWALNHYFIFPQSDWVDENFNCILDSLDDDQDQDGMNADIDISIDDSCPQWQKLQEVKSFDGTCTHSLTIITETGRVIDFGDKNIINKAMNNEVNISIDDYKKPSFNPETGKYHISSGLDCNDIPSLTVCGGDPLVKSDYDSTNQDSITQTIEDGSLAESQDLDSGNDNTGNTTETDYLSDLVQNTYTANENSQKISDQLTEINSNLIQNRESLKEELQNLEDGGGNSNVENDVAYNNAVNAINNYDSTNDIANNSFNDSDEFSTDIDSKINALSSDGEISGILEDAANNSILDGFKNSQILLSGDSAINIELPIWDMTLDFAIDAAPFEAELIIIGNILYAITVISCWIMILRGR